MVLGKVDRGVWLLDDLTSAYLLKPFHRHIPAKRVTRISPVAGSRSRGVARRSFRHDDEATWQEFMAIAESGASDVLRQFVDWYTRKPKAKMPTRPAAEVPPSEQ